MTADHKPYIRNLFMLDYMRRNRITLKEVCLSLEKKGHPISTSNLDRIIKGKTPVSDSVFSAFCEAYQIQYTDQSDPSLSKALLLKVSERLLNGPSKTPATDFDAIISREKNWLNSSDRFVYGMILYFLDRDAELAQAGISEKHLIQVINLSFHFEEPPLPDDVAALFYFIQARRQYRKRNFQNGFRLFERARHQCASKDIPLFSSILEYWKLKCSYATVPETESIELCDQLVQTFMIHQAYDMCQKCLNMKSILLIRSFSFLQAKQLCQKIFDEALISKRLPLLKAAAANLIWISAIIGEYEEGRKWIERCETENLQVFNAIVYKPFVLMKIEGIPSARAAFEEVSWPADMMIEDRVFLAALASRIYEKPDYSEKLIRMLETGIENRYTELTIWALDWGADLAVSLNQFQTAFALERMKNNHISGKIIHQEQARQLLLQLRTKHLLPEKNLED